MVCSSNTKEYKKYYIRELKQLFSLSESPLSPLYMHTQSLGRWLIFVSFKSVFHMCEMWPYQKQNSFYFQSYLLQLSWCKAALSTEAREECCYTADGSALSLSLSSLCTVSLSHCLPLSGATEMAALFCSPSLSSIYPSQIPHSTPPSLPFSSLHVIALQRSCPPPPPALFH